MALLNSLLKSQNVLSVVPPLEMEKEDCVTHAFHRYILWYPWWNIWFFSQKEEIVCRITQEKEDLEQECSGILDQCRKCQGDSFQEIICEK